MICCGDGRESSFSFKKYVYFILVIMASMISLSEFIEAYFDCDSLDPVI